MERSRDLRRGRSRGGQIRIIEAILSAAIIVVSITIGIGLMKTPSPLSSRRTEDVSRFAYSLLFSLAEAETFDRVMYANGSLVPNWEEQMKVMIGSLLPSNMFFNMTVYNCTVNYGLVEEVVINSCPISNAANPEVFRESPAVAGAHITYTTRRLSILRVHLSLTWSDQP